MYIFISKTLRVYNGSNYIIMKVTKNINIRRITNLIPGYYWLIPMASILLTRPGASLELGASLNVL
jgi:hypothetical protein